MRDRKREKKREKERNGEHVKIVKIKFCNFYPCQHILPMPSRKFGRHADQADAQQRVKEFGWL